MKVAKNIEQNLKNSFRIFFDGVGDGGTMLIEPIIDCSVIRMGITNIEFKYINKKDIDMTVTLQRPGLLIGSAGNIIKEVEKHLNIIKPENLDGNIKIKIIESRLWK